MSKIESPARGAGAKSANQNCCLAALSPAAFALLRPHLTEVTVQDGFVFWEGDDYPNTLFPVSGLVSIGVRFSGGENIEVASIGQEGAAAQSTSELAYSVGQGCAFIGGDFIRIPTQQLLAAASANSEVASLVEFCREWILTQSQQIAACNAVHSAEQRLARWLVQSCRRLGSQAFHATQDGIASALGIRRTTVTLLAQALQAKGMIQYRRGKIVVVDPAQLAESACECCSTLDSRHWPSTRLRGGWSDGPGVERFAGLSALDTTHQR
jgi:hypothetical protein